MTHPSRGFPIQAAFWGGVRAGFRVAPTRPGAPGCRQQSVASGGPSRGWGHPWFSAVPLTFLFSWPHFLPFLFPLGRRPILLLYLVPFRCRASLVLLLGCWPFTAGGDVMVRVGTASPCIWGKLDLAGDGSMWVCKEGKSGGFWDLLPLGAVTLKCCVSEDIQVVLLP